MSITGTRFVSQWINLGDYSVEQEGSPIDVFYFLTLIITGIRVIALRHVFTVEILRNNRWLATFFIYCFISIAWSDFPFLAFKRYIKILGHPVMALIILTDPDPVNALRTVMKRCAYLLIPLSVLFIKYYPQYGRGFDSWTGEAYNTGLMLTKNELGGGVMIFGLFFFWNLLTALGIEDRRVRREEIIISAGFLCMCGWLLYMAHSSTALATFIIGIGTIFALGFKFLDKRFIGTYVFVGIFLAIGAEWLFDVYKNVVELLGEDPTLTDRTKIWADCLALVNNPLLGTGFESFWLGSRLEILWAKWFWHPNQAHNGYIETYLNLGAVGIVILIGLLISTFRKISSELLKNFAFARLQFGFLVAIVFFNYTEAIFKGVAFIWTIFHIIAINYPRISVEQPKVQAETVVRRPKYRYKKTLNKTLVNSKPDG